MDKEIKKLDIETAYKLLNNAPRKNKDMWIKHSVNVAIVAERLAESLGLDSKRAYVYGLIHDIGRGKKDKTGFRHIIDGYKYLVNLGYEEEARYCLTHSFYIKNIDSLNSEKLDITEEEAKFLKKYIKNIEYNSYDRLVQLADNMGLASGITIVERRRIDVMLRYGVSKRSLNNLRAVLKIQKNIEEKLGYSIYKLFPEVSDNINKNKIKDVLRF